MSVIIIGNFDGVHRGHQKLIATAKEKAAAMKTALLALTFEPHPQNLLSGKGTVPLITPFLLKKKLMLSYGVDRVEAVFFDRAFASLSAGEFLTVLKEKYDCSGIVCGENSHFGKGGSVSAEEFLKSAREKGIDGEMISLSDFARTSSSEIRRLLSAGEMEEAATLLGRPYTVETPVVSGNRIGRTIGFPTVNQPLPEEMLLPPFGVYAATAKVGEKRYAAVLNLGVKPTVGGEKRPLLETHFLDDFPEEDFSEMTVFLHVYLRPEKKFESLDDLRRQILSDSELAQKILRDKDCFG